MEHKIKILIVEDNPHIRHLMAIVLGRSGYEIFEAADALEALEEIVTSPPDLVILDLALPGPGGDELIGRIKADPCIERIPVIVATALPSGEPAVDRAIVAGATQILFKPIELKILLASVNRCLGQDN